MLNNFFKATFRNLWKNKTYSFLNIFGLAIGIACAGLIFLWVEEELNYDGFNVKKDRLYFARVNATFDAGILTHWSTPGVMGPAIQAEIPGIENTCRTTEGEISLLFSTGDKSVYADGKYAEPSLFNMFTLPFVQGNARAAFAQLNSLVITEKTAKKIFGNEANILGKVLRVDNKQDYVITGVLKDIPQNSSLQFEWLAPFQIWYQQSPWAYVWENNCVSTYVELMPGANLEKINTELYNFVQKKAPTSIGHVFLNGMNDWHLRGQFENGKQTNSGGITFVRMFSIIAWIILIIACINFMNLSTARSEKRAREVGVRKVLGAGKKILVAQFIGEALFMATLAASLSVIIMTIVLPSFNTLVQKTLYIDLGSPGHLFGLAGTIFICGLIAGSYPSLYLSSFNPVSVLKGVKLKTGSAPIIRKGLVILQFTISIVLIIATIVIYQQIQHVKNRSLGFNKDNLIELNMQGEMAKHFVEIRQDLINTGLVQNVALADHSIITGGNNTDELSWQGKKPGNKILISWRNVNPDFFSTAGMQIMEGRDFDLTDTTNLESPSEELNVIITQSLAKLMNKESALGNFLFSEQKNGIRAKVVGVVKDYVYGNMYSKPDPVMFVCMSPRFASVMYVRSKANSHPELALSKMESLMKKDNPGFPFEYKFVDDQFNESFSNELLVSKLSNVFAALAIMISSLGLFGLAAYTAERRTKEIAIRKVLGASVAGVAGLLSKDFIQLVLMASIVAFPIAWWAMHNWLRNYQYRIEISWWIFIAAGALAVFIALITICFQAIRAAIANPAKSLRTE